MPSSEQPWHVNWGRFTHSGAMLYNVHNFCKWNQLWWGSTLGAGGFSFILLPAFCAGSNFWWPPTASLHICFWGLCFKCWHIEVDNKGHKAGAEPCPWKPPLSHSSAFWCGYGLVMKCFWYKARGSRELGHPWQAGSKPCWGLAQQALHGRDSLACVRFLFATSPLPEFQEKRYFFLILCFAHCWDTVCMLCVSVFSWQLQGQTQREWEKWSSPRVIIHLLKAFITPVGVVSSGGPSPLDDKI